MEKEKMVVVYLDNKQEQDDFVNKLQSTDINVLRQEFSIFALQDTNIVQAM